VLKNQEIYFPKLYMLHLPHLLAVSNSFYSKDIVAIQTPVVKELEDLVKLKLRKLIRCSLAVIFPSLMIDFSRSNQKI